MHLFYLTTKKQNTMTERLTFNVLNNTDPKPAIAELEGIGLIDAVTDFCNTYSLRAQITIGVSVLIEIDGYAFLLLQVDDNLQRFTLRHSGVTFNCTDADHALQIFKAIIL